MVVEAEVILQIKMVLLVVQVAEVRPIMVAQQEEQEIPLP